MALTKQQSGDLGASSTDVLHLADEDISYPGFVALKQISLAIKAGEKVALVGKSGAGKTTLLRRLFQLQRERSAFIHQHYSLVPQLSVFHNIYVGRLDRFSLLHNLRNLIRPSPRRLAEIRPIAEKLALEEKLFQPVAALSGGQQQRVGIGRAFYRGSEILLADEPVASLDRVQQEEIMVLMTQTSQTVISSLHSIDLATRFFSRVIGLKDRRILFDLPATAINKQRLDQLYG
jgi:phosphonate transport system ATP-binding protein